MTRQLLVLLPFIAADCTGNQNHPPPTPRVPIFDSKTQLLRVQETASSLAPPLPDDAPCRPLAATYDLVIEGRNVNIMGCFKKGDSSEVRMMVGAGDEVWPPVLAGIDVLRATSFGDCVEDKGQLTITSYAYPEEQVFYDSDYACDKYEIYFDSQSAIPLMTTLHQLSQP